MKHKKITKVSKNSQQNSLETNTNENDKEAPKETPKERRVSPDERQKILIILILIWQYNTGT